MKAVILVITSMLYLNLANGQTARYEFLESPLYIVNKNYVIYQDAEERKIIYPDLNTFKVLDFKGTYFTGMAVDKNGIYFKGTFIKADTTGIEIVGTSNTYPSDWLWKTKTQAFSNLNVLKEVHAPTFSPIGCFNGGYFKDKNAIYYFDKRINKSDGVTVNKSCDFELCYDKNYVYLKGERMHFEGEVVKPVNEVLFKTKSVVMDRDSEVLQGADPKSLIGLSRQYAMDDYHLYYGKDTCVIAPENLENVKVWDQINSRYYSDGKNIYAGSGYLFKEMDAASFGMLPKSDFYYDKNGVYERNRDPETNLIYDDKFPFRYDALVTQDNILNVGHYIIYYNQAYNPWRKKIHFNISSDELNQMKSGAILDRDSMEYNRQSYPLEEIEVLPNTPFSMHQTSIRYGEKELISNENLALLSVFKGYRRGCGSDPLQQTNIYFFKNIAGYWLIETKEMIEPTFLGAVFNPKWNLRFTDFELPE